MTLVTQPTSQPSAPNPTTEATKVFLGEADIPTHWYNIVADLPTPVSYTHLDVYKRQAPARATTW